MKLFSVNLFCVRMVASGLNADDKMNTEKTNKHNKYGYQNLTARNKRILKKNSYLITKSPEYQNKRIKLPCGSQYSIF